MVCGVIRFFCQADTSELGTFALSWIPFLQALDIPVRIAAAGANLQTDRAGRSSNPWAKYASMFATPLGDGPFANVICQPQTEWHRHRAVIKRTCTANLMLVAPGQNAIPAAWLVRDYDMVVPTHEIKTELETMFAKWGLQTRSLVAMKPTANNLVAFRVLTGL
jgi:hypothetical protein